MTTTTNNQLNAKQQLFLTVAVIAIAMYAYHLMFSPLIDVDTKRYKENIEKYEMQLDSLQNAISIRDTAIEKRNDSISMLSIELQESQNRTTTLTKQLQNAKQQLINSSDSSNVSFFKEYISSRK